MLEVNNTVAKIKHASDELINTLDTIKKRISELEEMLIETHKTEMKRKQKRKERDRIEYPRPVGRW